MAASAHAPISSGPALQTFSEIELLNACKEVERCTSVTVRAGGAASNESRSSGPAANVKSTAQDDSDISDTELLNACEEIERGTFVAVRSVGSESNETRSIGPAVHLQKAPQDDSDISETELLNVCKEMEMATSMTVRVVSSGNVEPEKDVLVAMGEYQDSSSTDLFRACREMEQRLFKSCRNSACDVDVQIPMVSETARGRADIAMTCTNSRKVVVPERKDCIDSDISDSELLKACDDLENRPEFEKRRRVD